MEPLAGAAGVGAQEATGAVVVGIFDRSSALQSDEQRPRSQILTLLDHWRIAGAAARAVRRSPPPECLVLPHRARYSSSGSPLRSGPTWGGALLWCRHYAHADMAGQEQLSRRRLQCRRSIKHRHKKRSGAGSYCIGVGGFNPLEVSLRANSHYRQREAADKS